MKIKNIFKKATKTVITANTLKANVQKLEKNQLETVVGGAVNNINGGMPNRISM